MYIYDSDYQIKDNLVPQQLRDIVKRCMLQTNNLAQILRNLANEHNVEEVSLHINCDSNTARAPSDIAALIVKPNGTAKASPRTLIIYPHKNGFTQDFPGLDTEAGQNGYFLHFKHKLWDVVTTPMLTVGGTRDAGWGIEHEANFPTQPSLSTVTEYTRFRLLLPELQIDAQGSFERSADGGAILDRRWFAKTKTNLFFPFSRLDCLGKLASQWAIDHWIRREEQDLDWVRKNQELLTRGNSNANAGVAPGVAPTIGPNPTAMKPTIPASFYGSKAFLKDQTFNALALCRKIGKPLIFLTFTCNPN